MKSHLHPRTPIVQQHAQSLCASFPSDQDLPRCSRRSAVSCRDAYTYERPSVPPPADRKALRNPHQNRISHIQIP